MIALSGIFLMIAIIIFKVYYEINGIPTQKEEDDLANKLNRLALDRNNKEK